MKILVWGGGLGNEARNGLKFGEEIEQSFGRKIHLGGKKGDFCSVRGYWGEIFK